MKPRNTLIVVSIFILLAGYVYFFELNKTPEELSRQLGTPTAKPPTYVLQLNADQVQSIEVSDLRAPRQVQLTRGASIWQVTKPETKPAEQFKVQSTLTTLSQLTASRVLTNVTNLANYGFVTPTLEIRLTMNDGAQYAVTAGGTSPNGSSYYVIYTGDKSQVFMVDNTVIAGAQAWLDAPPYEPTPTPTFPPTPTPEATETPAITPTPATTGTPKP